MDVVDPLKLERELRKKRRASQEQGKKTKKKDSNKNKTKSKKNQNENENKDIPSTMAKNDKGTSEKKQEDDVAPAAAPTAVVEDGNDDDDDVMEEASNDVSKEAGGRRTGRELRRQRRGEQRTKNMGLGLSIDIKKKGTNKIVFGDDEDVDNDDNNEGDKLVSKGGKQKADEPDENKGQDEPETKGTAASAAATTATTTATTTDHGDDGGDMDEDDAVEEVKTSSAKEQVLEQRAEERKSAKLQRLEAAKTKKKRKRKEEEARTVSDELDEDFFAQVDSDMAKQRKEQKKGKIKPIGRHTTFVTKDDNDVSNRPGHGIEVVVVTDTNRLMQDKMGTQPSATAKKLSKSAILQGGEEVLKGHDGRKGGTTWKRSKKMNRVLSASGKERRSKAAAHFVVQA